MHDVAGGKPIHARRSETIHATHRGFLCTLLRRLGIFLLPVCAKLAAVIWSGYGCAWLAILGAGVLVLYGVIPTLQPAHFGRVYAAYGGVFVILSVLWGWKIDGVLPDTYDVIGALLAMLGVGVMMYWPR